MNGSTRTFPVAICLWACFATQAWGQAALPTDYDMRMARQRMEEALGSGKLPKDFGAPSVPKVESLPKPEARQADIAKIAEGYRQFPATSNRTERTSDSPELMIFVSFSMPRESLERIVIQSEKSGAVMVLRGFKGNSMARMGEEIAKLIGKRNVTAHHPPAGVHSIQGDAGSGAGTGQTQPGNPDWHRWLRSPNELHQGRRRCNPGLRA
jgi:hypothetical protein